MMFRPRKNPARKRATGRAGAFLALAAIAIGATLAVPAVPALADGRFAVIPKRTIYPGEQLDATVLEEVAVTNPNIAPGYAERIEAVDGLVTRRTLVAGRIILVSSLREPFAVSRGKAVRLVFQNGPLMITASGSPLDDAAVGDLIKVRNLDSGVIVTGTVMEDRTVHVVAK
ncbi:flagellar basal body P-ring formation chaperone FlgA [Rhizobium sp. GN54]|uniref:flagellar basal body P-ring formation chaperone FlgA n=1 Tax=Rhizobium sp. GN54 TaxID=2898150 RepID=UPI001E28FFCC|nr:flagellar basal body P-ring formation chaperone FlgA [Rhizobium sp. GN54]MCD2183433.1 flagellar basal body P-ring formation protein FlgA [Rhizobium sp. GN54]